MDATTPLSTFDSAYMTGTPPWVIDQPQPAIVDLERAGGIRGAVLDPGCGTGEHTILLSRLGYDVLGVDAAPHALERARANAARHGVTARFELADALHLGSEPRFDTVVDSALFHIFGDADRAAYVRGLHAVCRPGGVVHVLALAEGGPPLGPKVSDAVIRAAFADGWTLEALRPTTYRVTVPADRADALGLEAGARVDLPAWLARARWT